MSDTNVSEVEQSISQLLRTRYNEVTGRVEYTFEEGQPFQPITDRVEKTILRSIKPRCTKASIDGIRNILQSDFSTPYNPFVQYFDELSEWDGVTDHVANLCSTLSVQNDEHLVEFTKKWLVGLVAGCLDSNVVNHQVLVLSGGQGVGKTTFFTKLVPTKLRDYYFTGFINPENKDAQVHSSECFLVNMDELSALNTKSIEALKQLITQNTIRLRRAYTANPEVLERRASFCGTTNEKQFLVDTTGNRRFLCFSVDSIDLEALHNFNIDEVYSQVYELYKSGFRHYFNEEENAIIEAINNDFTRCSQEEEAVLSTYQPWTKDSGTKLCMMNFTATEVTQLLAERRLVSNGAITVQRVGKALNKLGFNSRKSNGRRLYQLELRKGF